MINRRNYEERFADNGTEKWRKRLRLRVDVDFKVWDLTKVAGISIVMNWDVRVCGKVVGVWRVSNSVKWTVKTCIDIWKYMWSHSSRKILNNFMKMTFMHENALSHSLKEINKICLKKSCSIKWTACSLDHNTSKPSATL